VIKASVISVLLVSSVVGQLEEFLSSPVLKTASVGVVVRPLGGGEEVASHQADLALIPASTLKAVTTATALQVLGPDYVFETRLFLKGDDLVIVGGGDPMLSAESFPAWWESLKKSDVKKIKGKVMADPSRFESQRVPNSWPWGDVGNYYGAGASGLNFNRNSFAMTFQPGKVGEPAKLLETIPTPPGVAFENRMRTGPRGSGDQGNLYGGPGAKVVSMRGTVPAGGPYTIYGALPDASLSCALGFRDFLRKKNFPVLGEVELGTVDLTGARLVHSQKSVSLEEIIRTTNFQSVNLYADSLFKALTKEGSSAAAIARVKKHWEKQGVDLTGFVMHDGSGLSPRNVITPRQLVTILKKARVHKSGDQFLNSLPVAGRSGSVGGFGKGTAMEGRVWVKPGGLTGVRTYSGYFVNKSGKEFVFAVMINNPLESPAGIVEKFLSALVLTE
jgi:D-alanyl-D-alanine carboxypeptidase/D-alanyl-D-alanine-endopeptidase (penicillin-binding protein 4)